MIRLSDNLEINKPAPVDDRLGVFSSTASALAYRAEDRRYIGLTLIVDTGSGATEYWFENGVENADLVAKSGGGGGATWGTITGTLSTQTDLQNALNAKENTITAGTTAQYYRGDKTFQTLNSTAVGLGNVDNTSDANKPISTATQTALDRITTLFQNVSQLTTTSTTAVTLTTFTVASSIIPVGGVIRISGLIERTAGSGNTTVGINVNSGGARYLQSAGTNSQFEMLICKTTSTNVRYGLGASNTTGNSFTGHNSASISVAQDGSGNFVISFLGLVGSAGATLTVQFVKGNLL